MNRLVKVLSISGYYFPSHQKGFKILLGSKKVGFCSPLQGLQETGFEQNFQEVQNLAEEMSTEKGFLNK